MPSPEGAHSNPHVGGIRLISEREVGEHGPKPRPQTFFLSSYPDMTDHEVDVGVLFFP